MATLPSDTQAYDDTEQHYEGEGYSSKNKIPTISALWEKQKRMTSKSDTGNAEEEPSEGQQEKKEMMDKAKAGKENPAKSYKAKGEREVLDPVTKQMVTIKDAELKDYRDAKLFSKEALDPGSDKGGLAQNIPEDQGLDNVESAKKIAPNPIEPSNILLQQFPPPVPNESVVAIAGALATYSYAVCGALALVWFFVAFGAGWMKFFFRTSIIGALAFGVYVSHGIIGRKIEKELERIRLNMLNQRADKFSPPTPESTEWLNAFTKVVWPLINPDMFTSLVDMIEDVMSASLPSFVDAVKVNDFTIGHNALRIVAMRALPDQPHEKDYPKEEWIDQGTTDKDATLDPEKRKKLADGDHDGEPVVDLDQTGDYINMEISFAYFAPPGTKKLQGENISLIIQFFLGFHDWMHIPIPIYIAVESIVGTVRLRLQMVSEAPFIRNCTFTLMGVPRVEASAIPMTSALPNVLDLPLISGFVQSSIAAACSIYTAPKSMTMNLAQMLSGDGIKKDTKALGILAITIHYAENLSAQDDNGFSDPYVVLAYAKFGKPLFSTRIITKDLNPVWEETAYLLVSDDEVRAQERLSIQLWDSDDVSADDLVGRVQVPLVDLMLEPNMVHDRVDTLMGFEDTDADSMSGTLNWSVAYYDKAKLNPALKMEPGIDHTLPKELQDRPELKVETTSVDTAEEADVTRTPPDPRWPAGVLSVIIHQINNLENQNLGGASGKDREGQAGQDTDAPSEQDNNLPSAYCEIVVNDDLVYKTRVKQYSTMPFFEAGTELFVHDWQQTKLRVVVRDSRLREHDPILGIVDLPLAKVLAHSSQVTRLFALQDGVGFGRVNISILFKGVQIDLPRNLRGWDTGTICVTTPIKVLPEPGTDFNFKEKKLLLSTIEADSKLSGSVAKLNEDGTLEYAVDPHVRLPTYDRFSSALFFDYGGGMTLGPLGKKYEAYASLWLRELVDNEPTEIRIPIVVNKDKANLRQNYINDQTKKTHKYDIVGWLVTTVLLDSGLDEDHEKYATTQTRRHEFETYDRVEGQAAAAELNSHAEDDGVVDKQEAKAIAKAHKKALESRQRGVMQFKPIRTAVWATDGVKDRVRKVVGKSQKEETVASETS